MSFILVSEVSQHVVERLDLNHWRQVDLQDLLRFPAGLSHRAGVVHLYHFTLKTVLVLPAISLPGWVVQFLWVLTVPVEAIALPAVAGQLCVSFWECPTVGVKDWSGIADEGAVQSKGTGQALLAEQGHGFGGRPATVLRRLQRYS